MSGRPHRCCNPAPLLAGIPGKGGAVMGVAHRKTLAVQEDGWEAWLHRHRLRDPSMPVTFM